MFHEVELSRTVTLVSRRQAKMILVSYKGIMTILLMILRQQKVSKDHGYFLSVTKFKSVGKRGARNAAGEILVPVVCSCRTFMPVEGEILEGVVYHTVSNGVLLKCGPMKLVYLSERLMPNYRFILGEKPAFKKDDTSIIADNVAVRFLVLAVRWSEPRSDFEALASLRGPDTLGPIPLSGSENLDL